MSRGARGALAGFTLALMTLALPVWAFNPGQTFRKGTVVVSGEAGYGESTNVEDFDHQTGLQFWNTGVRASIVPFGPTGSGPLYGALETGLEPFYQQYTDPATYFAGLAVMVRYHFLALGRLVPYAEIAGAAGGTNLKIPEIRSDFTFLVFGGVGTSFFVTDRTALYAGYRFEHVSNGNTSTPNRGFESHVGVAGVSFYFPD